MTKGEAAKSGIAQGLVLEEVVITTFFCGLSDEKLNMTWQYALTAQK